MWLLFWAPPLVSGAAKQTSLCHASRPVRLRPAMSERGTKFGLNSASDARVTTVHCVPGLPGQV